MRSKVAPTANWLSLPMRGEYGEAEAASQTSTREFEDIDVWRAVVMSLLLIWQLW